MIMGNATKVLFSCLLMTALFSGIAVAVEEGKPESISCEVSSVSNEDRNFFHSAAGVPPAPIVGDKIVLEVGGDELGALDFESGNTIPLNRFNAVIPQVSSPELKLMTLYAGTHQGILNYYEAAVLMVHGEASTDVSMTFQKGRGVVQSLTIALSCNHVALTSY